jgi:hypothetical protein
MGTLNTRPSNLSTFAAIRQLPAPPRRAIYRIEGRPTGLPSVSKTSEMKPYCPMENFSLKMRPPC